MKKITLSILFLLSFQFLIAQLNVTCIENHLEKIIKTEKPRNYKNVAVLNKVANYIHQEFKNYSNAVSYQNFNVNGKTYKNVICVFGEENKETIVIGAHYDVCGNQDGADDNASGIVGLLELARLLKGEKLNYRIELVAYSLEEPPFFRTKNMGSYIHAKSLEENNTNVYGMISLEMIGYFNEEANSQNYPIPEMKQLYGTKADFITIVSKQDNSEFTKEISQKFIKQNKIKSFPILAPTSLEGIDFSDHLNYWKFGFDAVMITDTAFFRNHNYHQKSDTIDTLNLEKMAKVIDNLHQTLLQL
ncbi:M28 family peptidase [Aureivirga marina]|uniref:M28 family peptidase n=1 Tax=Aureivirga marina TaxID=1182451 RepID=UPI0018CABEBE|nr:M28 family peptidase [Aureivirga marina]